MGISVLPGAEVGHNHKDESRGERTGAHVLVGPEVGASAKTGTEVIGDGKGVSVPAREHVYYNHVYQERLEQSRSDLLQLAAWLGRHQRAKA